MVGCGVTIASELVLLDVADIVVLDRAVESAIVESPAEDLLVETVDVMAVEDDVEAMVLGKLVAETTLSVADVGCVVVDELDAPVLTTTPVELGAACELTKELSRGLDDGDVTSLVNVVEADSGVTVIAMSLVTTTVAVGAGSSEMITATVGVTDTVTGASETVTCTVVASSSVTVETTVCAGCVMTTVVASSSVTVVVLTIVWGDAANVDVCTETCTIVIDAALL